LLKLWWRGWRVSKLGSAERAEGDGVKYPAAA